MVAVIVWLVVAFAFIGLCLVLSAEQKARRTPGEKHQGESV